MLLQLPIVAYTASASTVSHSKDIIEMTDVMNESDTSATLAASVRPIPQPKQQKEPTVDITPEVLQCAARDLAEWGVCFGSYEQYLQRKFKPKRKMSKDMMKITSYIFFLLVLTMLTLPG